MNWHRKKNPITKKKHWFLYTSDLYMAIVNKLPQWHAAGYEIYISHNDVPVKWKMINADSIDAAKSYAERIIRNHRESVS